MMALFKGETVTVHSDWFTCEGARLQMHPFSDPLFDVAVAASISPAGPKTAGKHGAGLLSIAATNLVGFDMLAGHWKVMEEQAAHYGTVVDRRKWRMMGPMHIAETEEQALENCRYGLAWVFNYLSHIIPTAPMTATTYEELVHELNSTGSGVVGTPEMAINQIQRLMDESGGFGCYLFLGADLADWQATMRSYELFAQYVMPHFKGQLAPPQASYDWVMGEGDTFVTATINAQMKSIGEYQAERERRESSSA
jgi:limonene 1,2-monooxygenase